MSGSPLGPGSTTRRRDIAVPSRRRRGDETAPAVMRAVLDHGPVARSTVARLAGLSATTVSVVTGQLLEAGLLREVPEAAGPPGVGRPHVPIDVESQAVGVLGVHLGSAHATLAVLDLRGRVLTELREPYDAARLSPEDLLGRVAAAADGLLAATTDRDVLAMSVVIGGRVDPRAGTVVDHPVLGWRDVAVREPLAAATGLPVRLDGHARALVRAERLVGAAAERARESVMGLVVDDGVDVAFAVGATVHRGPRSAGGAVGHLPVEGSTVRCPCGRTGCLAASVSDRALLRRARDRGVTAGDVAALVDLASAGHPDALDLLHERARLVGRAAAMLLDLVDPEVLVVAEVGTMRIPACLAALRAEVASHSELAAERGPEVCVLPASFPDRAYATAAGAVALDRLYAAPLDAVRRLSRAS